MQHLRTLLLLPMLGMALAACQQAPRQGGVDGSSTIDAGAQHDAGADGASTTDPGSDEGTAADAEDASLWFDLVDQGSPPPDGGSDPGPDSGPWPPVGCCEEAADCEASEDCVKPPEGGLGWCLALPEDSCWSDDDCSQPSEWCEGESPLVACGEGGAPPTPGVCMHELPFCCSGAGECEGGELCAEGWCLEPPKDDRCWTDVDCVGDLDWCAFSAPSCWIDPTAPPTFQGVCVPDGATCLAVPPFVFGECKMLLGYTFDGEACVSTGGCDCGDLCDFVYDTMEACEAACPVDPGEACCWDGTDCDGGEVCVGTTPTTQGRCQAAPAAGQCWTAADCGPGDLCTEASWCGCGQTCAAVPGTCTDLPGGCCLVDDDCQPGEACAVDATSAPIPELAVGVCGPAPAAGACYLQSHCDADQICAGASATNCFQGALEIVAGSCVDAEGTCCATDDGCPPTWRCIENVCKPPPPLGSCWDGLDCDPTQSCAGADVCGCDEDCLGSDTLGTCAP